MSGCNVVRITFYLFRLLSRENIASYIIFFFWLKIIILVGPIYFIQNPTTYTGADKCMFITPKVPLHINSLHAISDHPLSFGLAWLIPACNSKRIYGFISSQTPYPPSKPLRLCRYSTTNAFHPTGPPLRLRCS